MATMSSVAPTTAQSQVSYVEWAPIVAGAIASLAVSLILLTFGAAVGLSAVSPWSTSSAAATAVGIGSAFWILIVSLWAFALGGYLAGRLRHKWADATRNEITFRDNVHGMMAWALAVAFTGFVAAIAPSSRVQTPDQGWGSSAAASTAVDTVLRSTRNDALGADPSLRAMVGRVFLKNLGSAQLAPDDQTYLAGVAAARGGDGQAAAERVSKAFTQFKADADRARKAGIVMAFLAAATLLIGGATAWWAAGVGGRHRDEDTIWEVFAPGHRTHLSSNPRV
ncbi:MAG: hypothetical protein JSS20_02585 [Proteobacteria bacterium]|nr:hypothetical protein [Pseudomonadota bacterium]